MAKSKKSKSSLVPTALRNAVNEGLIAKVEAYTDKIKDPVTKQVYHKYLTRSVNLIKTPLFDSGVDIKMGLTLLASLLAETSNALKSPTEVVSAIEKVKEKLDTPPTKKTLSGEEKLPELVAINHRRTKAEIEADTKAREAVTAWNSKTMPYDQALKIVNEANALREENNKKFSA